MKDLYLIVKTTQSGKVHKKLDVAGVTADPARAYDFAQGLTRCNSEVFKFLGMEPRHASGRWEVVLVRDVDAMVADSDLFAKALDEHNKLRSHVDNAEDRGEA